MELSSYEYSHTRIRTAYSRGFTRKIQYDTITASGGITPQTTGDNGHGGRHNFLDIRQINTQYDTMVYSRRQNQRDIYQPYRHGNCRRLFFLHPESSAGTRRNSRQPPKRTISTIINTHKFCKSP